MNPSIKRFATSGTVLSALVLLCLAAQPAGAQTTVPPPPSDTLTVFDPTGNIFAQATATEAQEKGGQAIIALDKVLGDPTQLKNPLFITDSSGTVSDIVGVVNNANGQPVLFFNSDDDLVRTLPPPNAQVVPESNGIFDVTKYLDPTLRQRGYTAKFVSDVPEGSSLAMMACGLAAIGGLGLRRRRVPTA